MVNQVTFWSSVMFFHVLQLQLWDVKLVHGLSSLPAVQRVVVLGTLLAVELKADGCDTGYVCTYRCILFVYYKVCSEKKKLYCKWQADNMLTCGGVMSPPNKIIFKLLLTLEGDILLLIHVCLYCMHLFLLYQYILSLVL